MEIVGRSSTTKPRQQPPIRKKFRWRDPASGTLFSAGGILFYDHEGFWTIAEATSRHDVEYTDPGGRYTFEDGSIYATIARELREESYGLCEILRSEVEDLASRYPPTLIYGGGSAATKAPAYMCLVVPVDAVRDLPNIQSRFSLDPERYLTARAKTIAENPDTPASFYSPMMLRKILFTEVAKYNLSYRLRRVLRFGRLTPHLTMGSTPSPPPPSSPTPHTLEAVDE